MAFSEHAKQAANRLANNLSAGPTGRLSVGITEEGQKVILIVHLASPQQRWRIPSEWEGYPVRTDYIGRMRPLVRRHRFG